MLIMMVITLFMVSYPCQAQAKPVAGTAADINYAKLLWQAMITAKLTGPNATKLIPFYGGAKPHGTILELTSQLLTINNHQGLVVVKKNYHGKQINEQKVSQNRAAYLKAYTVMYQREAGYDPDNNNWFWVKYKADGSLFIKKTRLQQVALAGRLFKGKNWQESTGCIYCHAAAGGGDYLFYDLKKFTP